MDILAGKTLLRKSWEEVAAEEALKDREVIGLYFSAHWCPPCRAFTPILAQFYEELRTKEKPFEIIFVSSDGSEEEMKSYIEESHGNWLALPYDDPQSDQIKEKFNIEGIPTLVVVKEDGQLVTTHGTRDVRKKGTACFEDWSDGRGSEPEEKESDDEED